MQFNNLEERMNYFRSLTDYKLMPNSYTLIMLDGRSFSKLIKNKYKKPFDEKFMSMMDETAAYVCKNIQGAKFAFVQSDEISILVTDFDTPTTDSFFGNRLCKIQSIVASLATAKFNQLVTLSLLDTPASTEDIKQTVAEQKLIQFDCKAWNVPTFNDVYAWFLHRQNDCIRNSKQQTAQTYLSHNELMNLDTDKQIQKLYDLKGIDWNTFDNGKKYGRLIYKEDVAHYNETIHKSYNRKVWQIHNAFEMNKFGKKYLEGIYNRYSDVKIDFVLNGK